MKIVTLRGVRTEQQILEAAALAHEIWREHYASILSPDQIEYMLQNLQSPAAIRKQIGNGYEYYLISSVGIAVGYVALLMNDPAPDMFLSKFYLRKDVRGKGYGKAALEKIDDIAAAAKQKTMWLTVNRNNPTVKVYEALGFKTEGTQITDIGGGYVMDDYIMRRPVM